MKKINEYMMQTSNFHSTKLNEYVKQASNVHPTQLDEYLSTKIKDASKLFGSFPNTFDEEEIIGFLDDNGFEQIGDARKIWKGMQDINDAFNQNGGKSYILNKYSGKSFWLMIFKGGKYSMNNPYFILQKHYFRDNVGELYAIEIPNDTEKIKTYDEFVEKANKFLVLKNERLLRLHTRETRAIVACEDKMASKRRIVHWR